MVDLPNFGQRVIIIILCVCVCVCVCVLPLDLRDSTRLCYSDKLSMNGMGCERSELERFCCKNVLWERDMVVLTALICFAILNC